MQRKLLFAIVALMCSVGTWAGTDVTASYIGDVTWIVNGGGHNHSSSNHKESDGIGWWNTQTLANGWHAFAAPNATGGVGESWTPGFGSAGVMMGRTMVLPAGNYTLSFDAFACNAGNSVDPSIMPSAGDAVAFLTGKDNIDITNTATAGDATFHNVSFTFDVTTANSVYEFGIKKLTDGSKIDWCQIKNVSLTLNSADISAVVNNDVAVFTYSGNQTWHTNNWSTEGQRDGTHFEVPFHELWVASGGKLADATIKASYTPTQTGVYKVSAWVRALNESGGAVSGAKIFVGDTEADACGGSAISNGSLGTFTAMADGENGTPFEYGFKLENAEINWLAFKNVTITYLGSLPQDEVDALLAQVPNGKMAPSVKTELDNRVSALESNASVANYNALASYIATANASVNDYANLATAISNAQIYATYKPVFPASETIYQDGITAAQTVYNNASAENCAAAIAALTTAIQNSNVNDYNIYVGDYAYSYATLLDVDMRNWSTTNWGLNNSDQHWNGITDPKQPIYEQNEPWGTAEWSHSATETVTLPAGDYVMGIIARASADVNTMMTVTVGEESPISTTLTKKGDVGLGVTTEGVASFAAENTTYANNNLGRGWEYRFVAFTVTNDDTDVTITVSASTNMKWNWVSLTNPLLKGTVSPNQVVLNQIGNLLTTLKGYESQIHASTFDTFSTDIANAEAATTETANLTDIVTALQSDIATASAMVTNMTTIATNKGDITSLINGTFDSNTDGWTGGNHVTGMARSWRSSSINNSFYERTTAGSMTCTLSNMPAGTYKVVAAWRSITGGTMTPAIAGTNGTTMTGVGDAQAAEAEINLNGVQMPYSPLGGFTTNNSGHNWQWITATGSLANDGDLVLSFTTGGTDGWNAIDDVHLYCTSLDGMSYTVSANNITGNTLVNTNNGSTANREVVTCDIITSNPNAIVRTSRGIMTAAGEQMNNNKVGATDINKLVLYDGYPYSDYTDDTFLRITNGAILYRNIPANTWCTLVVPFNPTNLDAKFIPTELDGAGVLTFGDAGTNNLNNKPMLVKSTDGVTAITGVRANSNQGVAYGDMTSGTGANMIGTYTAINEVPQGSYVVAHVNDADALYKVNSTVSLAPFRAYFSIPTESGVKANVIRLNFDENETAIAEIENGEVKTINGPIFNLAGQRMSKVQRGVNIINGKKLLVK